MLSYPMFRDLEAQQEVFTGIAAYDEIEANVVYEGEARSAASLAVSGQYFSVLGLQPALGRLIGPQDEPAVNETGIVVLGHDYWRRYFGGDPGVLDETLIVNGESLTIVGVAPADFSGTIIGAEPQVYVPLTMRFAIRGQPAEAAQNRFNFGLTAFARLRPGIEQEQASAGINALHTGIIEEIESSMDSPFPVAPRTIALEPGGQGQRSDVTSMFRRPLTLLFGLTLVVLLVVCTNVGNLLLARGAARANEMATRAALGASRRELMSQVLVEGALLAVVGGAVGLLVAVATLECIRLLVPEAMLSDITAAPNPIAILFAAGLSLSSVLVFGLAPAIQASRASTRLLVSSPSSRSSPGRGRMRFGSTVIVTQIAFSVVLLVVAGLFSQSLTNVVRASLGLDVESVVMFSVAPGLNNYPPDRVTATYERIEEALASQPGIESVAGAMIPLLSGSRFVQPVQGFDVGADVDTNVPVNMVGPGFFETLGVPFVRGREFDDTDTADSPRVVVVNERFVSRFNLGENAVGTRFGQGGELEIVGVVADAANSGSGVKDNVPPQFYQPLSQLQFSVPTRYYYVRSSTDAATLMQTIPRVIAAIDPALPVDNLRTMQAQFRDDIYVDRLVTALSASFAILATLLAAIGLYGMLTHSVTQRTREIGLRLALGALPGRLRLMVLKQVGVLALLGAAIGVAVAIALARFVEAMLFGVAGYDPITIVAAVAVLCVIVLTASYFPARRASNIAPNEVLRYE